MDCDRNEQLGTGKLSISSIRTHVIIVNALLHNKEKDLFGSPKRTYHAQTKNSKKTCILLTDLRATFNKTTKFFRVLIWSVNETAHNTYRNRMHATHLLGMKKSILYTMHLYRIQNSYPLYASGCCYSHPTYMMKVVGLFLVYCHLLLARRRPGV